MTNIKFMWALQVCWEQTGYYWKRRELEPPHATTHYISTHIHRFLVLTAGRSTYQYNNWKYTKKLFSLFIYAARLVKTQMKKPNLDDIVDGETPTIKFSEKTGCGLFEWGELKLSRGCPLKSDELDYKRVTRSLRTCNAIFPIGSLFFRWSL